jgi:DNA primase
VLTLREAQAVAYLLENGRWPDAETAEWFEQRASKVAIDYLLAARLRGTVAAQALPEEEGHE